MNNENTDKILVEAEAHFVRKNLDAALNDAEQALKLSGENGNAVGQLMASILIGKILTTKGRYLGDKSFFEKSLAQHKKAEHKYAKDFLDPNLYIELGKVLLQTEELEEAVVYDAANLPAFRNVADWTGDYFLMLHEMLDKCPNLQRLYLGTALPVVFIERLFVAYPSLMRRCLRAANIQMHGSDDDWPCVVSELSNMTAITFTMHGIYTPQKNIF